MKSIRRHLTVALLGVFVVLLGAGGVLIYFSTRAALFAQMDARLRVEALAVVKQTRQARDDEGEEGPGNRDHASGDAPRRELEVGFTDKYMPEFESGGTEYFQIWAPGGQTVKRSASLKKADLPRQSGTLEKPASWNLILPNGRAARAIGITFVPPTLGRERAGHDPEFRATLVVASGMGELHKTLVALREVLFSVGGLALLATVVAVPLLLRRGLAPLQRVADHATKLEAATLQAGFPEDQMPAELRPICARLNELLARLDQAFDRERRFSGDVAHELRTPIAELRSLSEVALKWPAGDPATAAAFQDALAVSRQMECIVTSLLAITRCEAGKQTVVNEWVEVEPLIRELWQFRAEAATRKNLNTVVEIAPGSRLQTDPAMLGSILNNLLSNAVAYTAPNGSIRIGFTETAGRFVWVVENTPQNLVPGDLSKLFHRFWRKDQARSSSEHSGLGLALAKSFANVLTFEISATLTGSTLTLSMTGPIHPARQNS